MSHEADSQQPLIVVADDDQDISNLVAECLKREGYRVVQAYDGNEALAQINEHRPQLVILDLVMPELYGYAVVRHMREKDETRDIPVILLSARTADEDVERGFEIGADDYLRKPFGTAELVARVRAALKRS